MIINYQITVNNASEASYNYFDIFFGAKYNIFRAKIIIEEVNNFFEKIKNHGFFWEGKWSTFFEAIKKSAKIIVYFIFFLYYVTIFTPKLS